MIKLPLRLYRVGGDSMLPTYRSGDVLLGWRWFRPHPGQVVIVCAPDRMLVKRIKRIHGGQIWLEGDNTEASTDSRYFGSLEQKLIQAIVIAKL